VTGHRHPQVQETVNLDRIPAGQSETVRSGHLQCDLRVEGIRVRDPAARQRAQIREALFPALPDTPREEEVTPHLLENPLAPRRLPEISLPPLMAGISFGNQDKVIRPMSLAADQQAAVRPRYNRLRCDRCGEDSCAHVGPRR